MKRTELERVKVVEGLSTNPSLQEYCRKRPTQYTRVSNRQSVCLASPGSTGRSNYWHMQRRNERTGSILRRRLRGNKAAAWLSPSLPSLHSRVVCLHGSGLFSTIIATCSSLPVSTDTARHRGHSTTRDNNSGRRINSWRARSRVERTDP